MTEQGFILNMWRQEGEHFVWTHVVHSDWLALMLMHAGHCHNLIMALDTQINQHLCDKEEKPFQRDDSGAGLLDQLNQLVFKYIQIIMIWWKMCILNSEVRKKPWTG